MALVAGLLLVVALGVFIARGDLLRPSGLDDSGDSAAATRGSC
jgi:hypothetical protein